MGVSSSAWRGREGLATREGSPDNAIGTLTKLLGDSIALVNNEVLVEDLEDLAPGEVRHGEAGAREQRLMSRFRRGDAGQRHRAQLVDADRSNKTNEKNAMGENKKLCKKEEERETGAVA